MNLNPELLYHIYNRGNNKQKIFFNDENYHYFLSKAKLNLIPFADMLAYCLMPNHFHFLIYTPKDFDRDKFSHNFKHLLSSYTRAINNQENKSGSLFQQNSRAKIIDKPGYGEVCFYYIHQNPFKSGLVKRIEDWEFSSFNEYTSTERDHICNKELALELLNLPLSKKELYEISYGDLDISIVSNFF